MQPSSIDIIKLQDKLSTINSQLAELLIDWLLPATSYNIYCYSISTQAVVMSTSVMY
mgnify:CR=1 FL=1